MAMPLLPDVYDAEAITAAARHAHIRLFHVPHASSQASPVPPPHYPDFWKRTTPSSIANFSALCYLTALHHMKLHSSSSTTTATATAATAAATTAAATAAAIATRPPQRAFGLIAASVGETDILSWMSLHARRHAERSCWQGPPAVIGASRSASYKDHTTDL